MRIDMLLVAALVALPSVACSHHDVRLEFPNQGVADKYDCEKTTGPVNCRLSDKQEPAAQNGGTQIIAMPPQCKSLHLIVIHQADSSAPTVHVECAPPENPSPPPKP